MRIQADTLTSIVTAMFEKTGSPTNEAALVSGSLVKANLMGHDSHGVGLVPTYVRHIKAGLLHPGTAAECVKDDGAIMMFDGHRGFGRRAGGEAMAATPVDELCSEYAAASAPTASMENMYVSLAPHPSTGQPPYTSFPAARPTVCTAAIVAPSWLVKLSETFIAGISGPLTVFTQIYSR